ncbi:Uma2 family endonuclease [Streptomyces niveiscabiei]|uniref:Uma2 family endonuclease n=1 Tax=Streptomyces niveiscabiei TaxID=164115 RepID=UPI0029A0014C|nr:Uma2 family endonuclease [Streptomyces niveiscabiei]MDX3385090.1 Uma2 family endonuclease [Streptomyces niveiscabiei]
MTSGPAERPDTPVEDFEELAEAAPQNVRLVYADGQVRTETPLGVEEFEELARRAPKNFWIEYSRGKLELKAPRDGNHSCMSMALLRQLFALRPGHGLYSAVGIKTEAQLTGRAVADGAFAPIGHFVGHGNWSDPAGIPMVVEITSRDLRTNQRARLERPVDYAEAGIPVYLLIDRNAAAFTVHSSPRNGRYHHSVSYPWGTPVPLPPPVGLTLDTQGLKIYSG